MKMKLLSAAMLAGLGVASTAQAVHVNPDGTGQVLLYPYYTVQNGYETYVHIVNTQNTTKAVKVRILEGMNSQEVLDFNLYLSPNDEWAAKIYKTDTGASIRTSDTSCTSGQVTADGIPFRNFQYQTDAKNKGTDRTREGYIEVIEMGIVTDADMIDNIAHTGAVGSRVPLDCAAVRTAATSGAMNALVGAPTGGMYGFASSIAVGSGLRTSYDAVALDNFWDPLTGGHHTTPGSLLPSLQSVETDAVLAGGANWFPAGTRTQAVDPVSAVLMRYSIMNDYVVDAGRNSSTNWIVTMPTKRFYVNSVAPADLAPFARVWNSATTESCDPIDADYFDREESSVSVTEDDFSPLPAGPGGLNLCHEVNTVSIKRDGTGSDASLYGAVFTNNTISLAPGFEYGWMRVTFTGDVNDDGINHDLLARGGNAAVLDGTVGTGNLLGLPVIGFAAFTSENTLEAGLSNYMGSTLHKNEVVVDLPL